MLKSIRLNVPSSMTDLIVDISFDKKNHKLNDDQIDIILKMKNIIDSFTSCKTTLNQVPMDAGIINNHEAVELSTNTQNEKLENGSNSNNELVGYGSNEGCIDLTKEFNLNNETAEANLVEVSSFFNADGSDFTFLNDDPNDILSDNYFMPDGDNNIGNEFLF